MTRLRPHTATNQCVACAHDRRRIRQLVKRANYALERGRSVDLTGIAEAKAHAAQCITCGGTGLVEAP